MNNEQLISKKILELLAPYSKADSWPVAYITINIQYDCPVNEQTLCEIFNKDKWDSELSSADLEINRLTEDDEQANEILLMSISSFESEGITKTLSFSPGILVK